MGQAKAENQAYCSRVHKPCNRVCSFHKRDDSNIVKVGLQLHGLLVHAVHTFHLSYFVMAWFTILSEKIPEDPTIFEGIKDAIVDEVICQTKTRIMVGRRGTQNRVRPHLDGISAYLDTFEAEGGT